MSRMSKIGLVERRYLEAVNRLLEQWIAVEEANAHPATRFPKTARGVLFAALNMIREHARRGERVAVIAAVDHIAKWLLDHSAKYKSARDILSQLRRRIPAGNTRGFERKRLERLYPMAHSLTFFGVQVQAVDAPPHLRLEAWLTAGTKTMQDRVPISTPCRDIPLVQISTPLDDPTETALVLGLLHVYRLRGDEARYATIAQHARRSGIQVPDLRTRTLQGLTAILRRRYARRYGSLESRDLTKVQRVALEVWYRHALTRWESASGEQDSTGSATLGALARKLGRHERVKHPDELLAEAAARERTKALQHWALERVEPTAVERAQGRKTFEWAVLTSSATLERIFLHLPQLGTIDELAAWGDRQFASYKTLEEEAVAIAEDRGMPTPNIQRAIRRLARPREQSWTELEARKIFEPGVSPIESEWRVQGMIAQLLEIMDRPRLDGGLEFAVERQLRYLIAVYRLIVRANSTHRG